MRPLATVLLALTVACDGTQKSTNQANKSDESCVGLPIEEWVFQESYWYYRGLDACSGNQRTDPSGMPEYLRMIAQWECVPDGVERHYEPLDCTVDECIAAAKALALAVEDGDHSHCEPYTGAGICGPLNLAYSDACPSSQDSGL